MKESVIHLTDTRFKPQGRRRGNDRALVVRLWSAVMDLTDGHVLCSWRRWAWQEQPVQDAHCSALLAVAYYMVDVCVWESVSSGRYNSGDTTTVYRPKACYDVVNIESCVGGFVAFSARSGFCKTQWARSVLKHTHTRTCTFSFILGPCLITFQHFQHYQIDFQACIFNTFIAIQVFMPQKQS